MSKPFFITLPNRGRITMGGADKNKFLNGLITKDVLTLADGKMVYACLLTPQGKFLHDFFVYTDGPHLVLDCEGGARAQDLMTIFMRYKLRSDVTLTVEPEVNTYAVFGDARYGFADPRHPALGYRCYQKPDGVDEKEFTHWDRVRILNTIPDGSRDMEIGKSILLEYGIDRLNGIDFQKGCYMGQELTARTHYRALIKKHLRTLKLINPPPPPFTEAMDGVSMRTACGDIGLAMVRDDIVIEAL